MGTQIELFQRPGFEDLRLGGLKSFVSSEAFPSVTDTSKKNYLCLITTLEKFYRKDIPVLAITETFADLLKKPVFGRSGKDNLSEKSQKDYWSRLVKCLGFYLNRYEELKRQNLGFSESLKSLDAAVEDDGIDEMLAEMLGENAFFDDSRAMDVPTYIDEAVEALLDEEDVEPVTLEGLYVAVSQADASVFLRFLNAKGALQFEGLTEAKLEKIQIRYRTALRFAFSAPGKDALTSEFSERSAELLQFLMDMEEQQHKSAKQRVNQVNALIRNQALFFEPEPAPEVAVETQKDTFWYIYRERTAYLPRKPRATLAFRRKGGDFIVALSRCLPTDNFSKTSGRNICIDRLNGSISGLFGAGSIPDGKALAALFKRAPILCEVDSIDRLKRNVSDLILRDRFGRLVLVGSYRVDEQRSKISQTPTNPHNPLGHPT